MTEFVVMLCFSEGIPYVGLVGIRDDGEVAIHDVGLDDVILLRSKMAIRGGAEFPVLSDKPTRLEFEMLLGHVKFHEHLVRQVAFGQVL